MSRDKQDQVKSLHAIVAGVDAWPEFWDDYGKFIIFELRKFNVSQQTLCSDIFQELVLQLIKNDKRALRRFLDNPESQGFPGYLRVILQSVVINYFRKNNKHNEFPLFTDGQLIPNSNESTWSADPLRQSTRHARSEQVFLTVCENKRESETFRILCLRFIERESVNNIAKRLNLKPNTVSQRIKYYLKKIEKQFGEDLTKVLNE